MSVMHQYGKHVGLASPGLQVSLILYPSAFVYVSCLKFVWISRYYIPSVRIIV